MRGAAVIVPVKSFRAAKSRLAGALDADERRSLAERMTERVLHACGTLPVLVVTDDDDVEAWAGHRGAEAIRSDGLDLNGSVRAGLEAAADRSFERVIVAHADLPAADRFDDLCDFSGVTLVPDRRADGTNVVCCALEHRFEPSYGPGSFQRHLAQFRAKGLAVRIARRPDLQWDVDEPADLPPSIASSTAAAFPLT